MRQILYLFQRASGLALLSFISVALLAAAGIANAATTACTEGEGNNCFLEISAPDSVAAGQPFTVKVTLFQYSFEESPDFPLPKSDFCASKTVVSLEVFEGESSGTIYTAKANGGVATFNLVVPEGSWNLDAFVDNGEGGDSNCGYFDEGFDFFETVNVPPGQPITPCPVTGSCVQTTSETGSAATLFSSTGGALSASFEAFVIGTGCGDSGPVDTNGVLAFDNPGSGPKTIALWLAKAVVVGDPKKYKICWQAPYDFAVLGGGSAVFNVDTDLYAGYLPKCSKKKNTAVPPCVQIQKKGKKGTAFFRFLAPAGDPKAYPSL